MTEHTMNETMDRLGDILGEIDQIVRAGFATYRRYPADLMLEHSPRAAATCTYDHIVAEADRRLLGREGIRQIEIRGLKLWLLGEHSVIRWKKMDEDGHSRNYPTKQARDYDFGKELPGLPPPPVRLVAGYLANQPATEIVRVQIAKPIGKRIDWCAAIVPAEEREVGKRIWVDVTRQHGFG